MPESAKDRPTTAYEQLYMFTKSQRYNYDHEAVRIGIAATSKQRYSQNITDQTGSDRAHAGAKTNGNMKAVGGPLREDAKGFRGGSYVGGEPGVRKEIGNKLVDDATRSLRQWELEPPIIPDEVMELDIWDIPTRSFKEAHFATFPPDLVYRCLQASGMGKGSLVLDPFGGAGTTALVADRLQMDAILIELNPKYVELAQNRILDEQGMFSTIEIKKFVDENEQIRL